MKAVQIRGTDGREVTVTGGPWRFTVTVSTLPDAATIAFPAWGWWAILAVRTFGRILS